MPKISQLLEQLYLSRVLPREAAPAQGRRFLSVLEDFTRHAPVEAGLLAGVALEDWPELQHQPRINLHPVQATASLNEVAANGSGKIRGPEGKRILLASTPGALTHLLAGGTLPGAVRLLGFNEIKLSLAGSADASPATEFLRLAGWKLRGFRDCEVGTDGELRLSGAWFELDPPQLENARLSGHYLNGSRSGGKAAAAMESAFQYQLGAVRQIALQRQELVERYRQTDEKRRRIHRKIKTRLRQARRERKEFAREARQHERRCEQLVYRAQRLRDAERYFKRMAGRRSATGAIISPYERKDPAEWLEEDILERTPAWNWLQQFAWSGWMRLGVLHQYERQALRPERIPGKKVKVAPLRISLITPSYQQAAFLERTMQSILQQDYPNLEYMVLDGGSRDGSADIIRKHAAQLAYWRSEPDAGQGASVAEGFARCTGDILAWTNSDDILLPGALAFVNEYFQRHPEVDALYSHRVIIDAGGAEVGRWILPPHDDRALRWADYVPQETLFWRRSLYEKAGGLDASWQFALDWDLLLRFQRAGARIVRVPYFLGAFRLHEAQKSSTQLHTIGADEVAALRRRELGASYSQQKLNRIVTRYQLRTVLFSALLNVGIRL